MQEKIHPDEALKLVLAEAKRLPLQNVPLAEALGLVLAEDIKADRDYPPYNRAMMDGYAVRITDVNRAVEVRGEVTPGKKFGKIIGDGEEVEIFTGAPCPKGVEAVVPLEQAVREGNMVTLPAIILGHQNIQARGAECRAGKLVLEQQTVIDALAIALLATFGKREVSVVRRPRVAIITTGDELVGHEEIVTEFQIRDSNGPMLSALARQLGLTEVTTARVPDSPAAFRAAFAAAGADIVLFAGAVSAGKYDIVPSLLAEAGATAVFHRVTQRPGQPLFFATLGEQLIFGLPGNPLSALVGFHHYVTPAIRALSGRAPEPKWGVGPLAADFEAKGPRVIHQLARVERGDGGVWQVSPIVGRGSADIYSAAAANAYVRFDIDAGVIKAGENVRFEWLGKL